MAKSLSEEEIKKINEELKKRRETPTLSGTDRLTGASNYRKQLEDLGKETNFDYLKDFDKIKNSLLQTSYSPYTRKAYTYEEKQTLTEEQYFNDLMDTANYTENFTNWGDAAKQLGIGVAKNALYPGTGLLDVAGAVNTALNTREGKSFAYGVNEATGGTALYKAIKGEEAAQEKANQVTSVYNRPVAQAIGNAAGTAALLEIGGTIGGLAGGAANATKGAIAGRAVAGGISGGSRAYTYSNDPVEIAAATASGAVYGLASGATTSAIKSAILKSNPSLVLNKATDFAVNAASAGAGAYAGTTASGTLGNTILAVGGKEVKFDDWIKPFWSLDTLTNVAVASALGGVTGTVKDQAELKTLPNDVRAMYAAGYARAKAINSSLQSGNVEDAKAFAASQLDDIERLGNKSYFGSLQMKSEFKQDLIDKWLDTAGGIFKANGYQFDIPAGVGGSASANTAGLIPIYGGVPSTPTPSASNIVSPAIQSTVGQANAPIQQSNIANVNNLEYNNPKGGMADEIANVGHGIEAEIFERLSEIERSYSTNAETEKIKPIPLEQLNKMQIDLANNYKINKGIELVFFEDDGKERAGFAGRDGRIYISDSISNQDDLNFILEHETAELMLLNNGEKVLPQMSKYVSQLYNADEGMTYYIMSKLDGMSDDIIDAYNSDEGRLRMAKEALCDIKGYKYLQAKSPDKERLDKAFGAETVAKIAKELEGIEKRVDFRKITRDPDKKTNATPSFAHRKDDTSHVANETRNEISSGVPRTRNGTEEPIINNLRNELVKKDDKIKATEMWSKRTERNKLNKKLDTAKDKLEQTKFDSKEKIKATKEEGKEKLHKLTSKKNEEKKEAVKEVKEKASNTLRAQKEKSKEQIKDAREKARATTTEKKIRLANQRLEKALDKVYDKPQSEELEKALDAVRKQGRGTIKLINNVRGKIPSSYSHFADDVLDIVDTYYTGGNTMTDEKRASLEKKAKAIEEYAKEHPEYPLSKKAIDLLKEPNKKNISDLNPRDLVSLAEDLQEIGIAVRDMFSFARASEDAIKLRADAIDFMNKRLENIKEPKNFGYDVKKILKDEGDKRSTIKYLTAMLSDGNPDSPLNFIPEQLNEGYDRYNRAYESMLKLFDKYVTVKKFGNVRYYNNRLNEVFDPKKKLDVTLKTTNGKSYTPSIRDAISVVLGAKDAQFAGHTIGVVTDKVESGKPVLSDGGIAVFSNNVDEQHGQIRTGFKRGVKVKLEASDIKNIEKALEKYPVVKELMDTFKELTDTTYKLNNEVYEAINGMGLEKRDYYIPITTDPATRARQSTVDTIKSKGAPDASNSLLNVSIVKPVVEGANGQILIYPIDDIINKLVSDTALYNGYGTALYDINTFLSAMTPDGETLAGLIDRAEPNYMKNYDTITGALTGRGGHTNGGKIAGNFTKGILKGNFWLALKQAGSYFTTAPYFDHTTRAMLAGIFNRGNMSKAIKAYYKEQGIDLSKLNATDTLKYFWRDKVNAELDIRDRGYGKADRDILLKHSGIIKRINALDWYKTVDIATINALAFASFEDSLLNPDVKMWSDEQFRDLSMNFINLHTATQPNTSPVTRAPIQINGNIIDRAVAFMGDPRIKNRNALLTAKKEYDWSKKHGTAEEKKEYKSKYARMVVGTLASLAYVTWVSRAKQDAAGKEKKTSFIEDLIGNMFGLTIGLEQIVGKFINDYSFDVTLPDTQAINLLFKAGEDLGKVFENSNDSEKMAKYIGKTIEDFSSFTGIPYKNLKSAYESLLNITGNGKTTSSGKKESKEKNKLDSI